MRAYTSDVNLSIQLVSVCTAPNALLRTPSIRCVKEPIHLCQCTYVVLLLD